MTTILLALIVPIPAWIVWESWRAHTLLAFCKEAKPGMRFSELLRLEHRRWINDSYLVQAQFEGYIDQAHSFDLEFRSHIYDPDFACVISHDGYTVTNVQLLTLEGFDAGS
jgi:hypothetical protein